MLIMMFILFISSTASVAHAVEAPDGFHGIKFGTDLSKVKGMRQASFFGTTRKMPDTWEMQGEKMSVGNDKCDSIRYSTFNNKFYSVGITFGVKNTVDSKVKDVLTQIYGEPKYRKTTYDINESSDWHYDETYQWNINDTVEIKYVFTRTRDIKEPFVSYLQYVYLPLRRESIAYNQKKREMEEEKHKQAVKKGIEAYKKDL